MSFSITQRYLVNNDCYKASRTIKPQGIMVHSTGANNPKLSRYIQPDDGVLGKNPYANDWNRSGISKCVHAFIGKDKDGNVACYQTLPWNHRGWHGGGKSNDTHIGFEICEDGLNDRDYFNKVYQMAVDLCVHLCKLYGLSEKDIVDHSEGFKKGIASNHGDVMHWFPRHGKSMDTFRSDVKDRLQNKTSREDELTMSQVSELQKQIDELKKLLNTKFDKPDTSDTPSEWAKDFWNLKVSEGYFDGTAPKGYITREQCSILIDRIVKNIDKWKVEPLKVQIAELEKEIEQLK